MEITFFVPLTMFTKYEKGTSITLKKSFLTLDAKKKNMYPIKMRTSDEMLLFFQKGKGFRVKKEIVGEGILQDVGHAVIHSALPALGTALGTAASAVLMQPELAAPLAGLGTWAGKKAADAVSSYTGVGLKNYMCLQQPTRHTLK